MNEVRMRIAKNLELDMPWLRDNFLQNEGIVSKGSRRLTSSRRQGCRQRVGVLHPAHALATPTRRGFHHDWIANLLRYLAEDLIGLIVALVPGYYRHPRRHCQALCFSLATHLSDHLGLGSNEDETGLAAGEGKSGVFGQEAIPWVDSVGSDPPGRRHNRLDIQVGGGHIHPLETQRLVGGVHVSGIRVYVGEHAS